MAILIIGLVLFLGIHSVRIVADGARTRFIATRGAGAWKGLYSLLSALGFVAILWGYRAARADPIVLWVPVPGMRHVAAALTLLAFVLLVAAYVPRNGIKARVHHPMVLAVMAWALAHLLAKGSLAGVVLFASFLFWAGLSFFAARQRDSVAGTVYAAGRWLPTLITLTVGTAVWALFALHVHAAWLGVRPFG